MAGSSGAGGASGAGGSSAGGASGAGGTGGAGGAGSSGGGNGGGGSDGGANGGGGGAGSDAGPKDASIDAGGSGGGSIDASNEPAPSCGTTDCKLKVQYECRQNGLGALKEMSFLLKVVNTGTTAIPLSAITMRYYFTIDSTATQQADCDSLTVNCNSVSFAFKTVTPAKPTADRYLEVGFTGAGSIAPGAESGEIGIRIHDQANLATYMQGNDYSFFSTGANYTDRMETPGYAGGIKVWGTEP
jgi:hypothetical protein